MKKIMIILMASAVGFGVQAQEPQAPWSLQKCIDYALENNISVRQQEITVAQNEIELNTSENSRLPGVSASASESMSFGRGLTSDNTYDNSNTTNSYFNLGMEVPVFQGFRIKHDIALQKLNLAASSADLDKIKDNVSVSVAQAYVEILYNMEILDVARNQVSIDSLQLERLEAMADNGKASMAEVAQQKSTLSSSRYSMVQAQNNLDLSVLELTQLLELPSPKGFSIVKPAAESLQPSLLETPEDIYSKAVETKPAIQAEMTRLDAANAQIALAKSSLLPTVSLSGGIGTNYYTSSRLASSSFGEQMKSNFSQSLGLTLSVPIFSRFSTRNSVRSSQLNYQNQQLQLESAKKSLYKEIQTAYTNAVASQSRYLSSMEASSSAEESFELVQAKYENGKANITEFNEAKNSMVKAQSDLAQAQYQNYYNSKILDFYKGLPLGL